MQSGYARQYANYGLSGGLADASNAQLRQYVQNLKAQEGGKNPNTSKIGGNVDWWERSKPADHPMNQYFDSFNRNRFKILKDLKKRVPEAFGLAPKKSDSEAGNGGKTPQDMMDTATLSGPGIPQWVWWTGGVIIIGGTAAMIFNKNKDSGS